MISELFLENLSLWGFVWQSTLFAVIGLLGSFLLRRRPARACQVLILAMTAAVIVPTMSVLVKHFELGMFEAEPIARQLETRDMSSATLYGASAVLPTPESQPEVHEGLTDFEGSSGGAGIPWRMIVLYGWMIATLILLGRLLVAFFSGVLLLRRAQSRGCEQIQRAADSARARLGITKGLQVRSSTDVRSPVIWCWSPTPVLLVPGNLDHRVDWEGVICHELAHWKRWDHVIGLIAELIVCILSWNPLLWWSKKRIVRLSEQACDDWVVAGGRPCEDYAQSLLDFKPQKQVAFVPAVVTSKKTLAERVRRILKDSCCNPRTGVLWGLVVSIVAVGLAVGLAFAQTRPSQPTGTIKTKVGRTAVIEQLASAMMIKGRILDPNNEPAYGARIVALPVTSFGASIRLNSKEGYFELLWSPTWLDKGQPIYLIAIGHYQRNEAAVVEITDPTQPVTIRLEPAATLMGKVIDPSSQRLPKYRATLSLATELKCQAPIFETTAGFWGERIFKTIPYGTKYRLSIRAEGYQTKQLTVDATDRSKEVIDIGTITLQPQDPAKSTITEQGPNPDLAKEFHEIYRLEEQEVIKLIKSPFVLGRQEFLQKPPYPSMGLQSIALQEGDGSHFRFIWDGKLKAGGSGFGTRKRLDNVLHIMLRMPYYDYNIPEELNVRLSDGDWIVRAELPMAEQLRALEEIIYAEVNRAIRFEKRIVERETIIVTGRYSFKPLSGEFADRLFISTTQKTRLREREKESVPELLRFIAEGINIAIDDRSEPAETAKVRYAYDQNLINPFRRTLIDKEKNLPILLDNLTRQTGLQFKVERLPAEIWFVTETKEY